jgi:hypothetical protein
MMPAPRKSAAGPSITVSFCSTIYNITILIFCKQGTAQFIAKEVLDGYRSKKSVARDVHHDLESFLLVIIYSLYKRFTMLNPKDDTLHAEFQLLFGHVTVTDISAARSHLTMSEPLPELRRIVADRHLVYLIGLCCRCIELQNQLKDGIKVDSDLPILPQKPVGQLMTYDQLDTYIKALLPPSKQA